MALVDCELLAQHLDDPAWRVFDCRTRLGDPAWGDARYNESHIPGALRADVDRDLSDPVGDGKAGRHPLPDPERFRRFLAASGVDLSTRIVAYDDEGGWWASRLWWLCRDLGLDAAVLDGGLTHWKALGLQMEPGPATVPTPAKELDAQPGQMPTVNALNLPPVLLDARVPDRYAGRLEPVDPVAGHIPGARNLPAAGLVGPDRRMLPPQVLRERFEAVGAGLDTACYCGSGVTATFLVLAMEVAGLPAPALYPESWSGWLASGGAVEVTPG